MLCIWCYANRLHLHYTNYLLDSFLSVTTEVLVSVRRMEESLKRLKAARGTTSNSGNQGMSDDDKIRSQLSLDVSEYISQVDILCILLRS